MPQAGEKSSTIKNEFKEHSTTKEYPQDQGQREDRKLICRINSVMSFVYPDMCIEKTRRLNSG